MRTVTRLCIAALPLVILVWRVGVGPCLDGIRALDGPALMAAAGLTLLATLCCAWRWRVMANGLGAQLPLRTAVAAYYRSLFLNVTLPGGIVGDVHRGVSHGRAVSDVGRGLRAVVSERFAGQAVQAAVTILVLLVLPSPVHAAVPLAAIGVVGALCGVVLVAVRRGPWAPRAWASIVIASVLAVAANLAMFVVAARTAGTTAPAAQLVPLALLVMAAMVLPSIAGWGPREGAAAWAFMAAGLGAEQGAAAAAAYGVMVIVASLPGAAFLLVAGRERRPKHAEPPPDGRTAPIAAGAAGAAHV